MKKVSKASIVFSVLMILTVSCSFLQENEQNLFESGLESLKTGDFYGAVKIFNKIDSLYPDSPYGYYGRGIANEKDRRIIDALNEYLRIFTNNADFAPGLKALIRLAARTDHINLALEISSQYREIENDSLAVTALNAEMLLQIGEYQLARQEMAKIASESSCNPRQHIFYSKLLAHESDIESALKHCAQAVTADGKNIEILMDAGGIYVSLGRLDSAAMFYREILKSDEADYYQLADVAEVFIEINYLADASRLIDELEQEPFKSNVIAFLKMNVLLSEGELFHAKEYYSKTIAGNKITPAQQLLLAEVRWKSEDLTGAIMALEHADQTAEVDGFHLGLRNEITLKKPELFLDNRDWRSVEGIMNKLEGLLPLDFKTVYLKASVGLLGGKESVADEFITRLEILVEDNPFRSVKFADLYMLVDSLEKAGYYYDLALTNDKINIGAILGKVNILKSKKRFNDAIDLLENQEHLFLSNRLLYPELVSLYREKGNLKKARGFVNSLINIAGGDVDFYRLAMELAKEDGHPEDFESIVKNCLDNNPDNGYAFILAGEYYMEAGQKSEAEKYLKAAIPTKIMLHKVNYLLGLLSEESGDNDSALVYYEKSADINPYSGEAYGRMAAIMINKENIDERTLALLMNYVRLSQRGNNNPDNFLTMGRAQVIQKRYKPAGINFNKALKADSNNAVYNYYAGLNYIDLDSLKKAKTYLNKAIKNGLSDELKSKAQNELNKL